MTEYRTTRRIMLGVLAFVVVLVVACNDATTSSMGDTVRTADTVHVVDTVRFVDTVRRVDTVRTVDTVEHVSFYAAAFHEDSTVAYCSQPTCPVVPGTGNFTGSITVRDDSMFVAFGGFLYDPVPMAQVHLDSVPTRFQIGGSCSRYLDLRLTATSNALRGRWEHQNSCDLGTFGPRGTFVATLR